jgi:hypothetical protein
LSQVTISVTIATIIDDMVAARMKRALLSIVCPGAVRSAGDFARNGGADQGRVNQRFTINGSLALKSL